MVKIPSWKMLSDTKSEHTFHAIPFNGEDSNWREWRVKVEAFALRKDFLSALENDNNLEYTTIKDYKKITSANSSAYII